MRGIPLAYPIARSNRFTRVVYDQDIHAVVENLAGVSGVQAFDGNSAYTKLLEYVPRPSILFAGDFGNLATGSGTEANIIRGWDGSASAADPAAGRATLNGGVTWDSGWLKTDAANGYVSIPHVGTNLGSQFTILFGVRQDAAPGANNRIITLWDGANNDYNGSAANLAVAVNGSGAGVLRVVNNGFAENLTLSDPSVGEIRYYALTINGTSFKLRYNGTNYTATLNNSAAKGGNSILLGCGWYSASFNSFSATSFNLIYVAKEILTDGEADAGLAAMEGSV